MNKYCDKCSSYNSRIKRNEEDIKSMEKKIDNMIAWVRSGMVSLIVGIVITVLNFIVK